MIELTGHLDIPTEIYESEPFQEILIAVGNVTGWTNDIISIRRDVASSQLNNLVVIVQHQKNCSLQAALNEVCTMIERETRRFQVLMQNFPLCSDRYERDVRTFLEDLCIWLRGARDWQLANIQKRYAPELQQHRSGQASTAPLEEAILPF